MDDESIMDELIQRYGDDQPYYDKLLDLMGKIERALKAFAADGKESIEGATGDEREEILRRWFHTMVELTIRWHEILTAHAIAVFMKIPDFERVATEGT